MASGWFSCKPCSEADPTQDTVKLDPNFLNKENVHPLENTQEKRRREAEEEQARRRKEEAAAAAVAEAARLREEVERQAATRARCEEAALARQAAERLQRETTEKEQAIAAVAELERAEAAAVAAAEEERRKQEAAKAAEEQAMIKRTDAEEKVKVWLKKNGFGEINACKKTFRGATKYPLHTAVKHNDQEIIEMMLLIDVQKDVKDSKNQTPSELAEKLNQNGSHDQILALLG